MVGHQTTKILSRLVALLGHALVSKNSDAGLGRTKLAQSPKRNNHARLLTCSRGRLVPCFGQLDPQVRKVKFREIGFAERKVGLLDISEEGDLIATYRMFIFSYSEKAT